MSESLYFYDLETSGINPRSARIMQFAGQRTNLDLEPIGEPDNILIKMTDDVLPDPQAILVTGITPQQTLLDGISEYEFCKYFMQSIATPDTTILGFNSVRFDNEFIRFLLYRNFYDPYEWAYANGRSVWDVLDLVRMTRALRPSGIKWPFAPDGTPSNSLERLTAVNAIQHANAHDALADVNATIAVTRMIRSKQPKLFSYLYQLRNKSEVQKLVQSELPFVYTTGRYRSEFQKTSVAVMLSDHPVYSSSRALVYDLRFDPREFMKLSTPDLLERLRYTKDPDAPTRLPVKELVYNKCPAVAPLSVLNQEASSNISINIDTVQKHLMLLKEDATFIERVRQSFEDMHDQKQTELLTDMTTVDSQLYDGFFNDADKREITRVRNAGVNEIVDLHPIFYDDRLTHLLLLYKARQFASCLSEDEQVEWGRYRYEKLYKQTRGLTMDGYFSMIQEKAKSASDRDASILEDLWLWGESIMPVSETID